MMYRCDNCGAEFDEPELYCSRENLDDENGWEITTYARCPYCGEEWFRRVENGES
jgi:DNA-directed RNA polymerase subunit RPC12/RpoP